MARDQRCFLCRQFAIDDMEIGAADSAGAHTQYRMAGLNDRLGVVLDD
jgi:hypothetical protein